MPSLRAGEQIRMYSVLHSRQHQQKKKEERERERLGRDHKEFISRSWSRSTVLVGRYVPEGTRAGCGFGFLRRNTPMTIAQKPMTSLTTSTVCPSNP